MSNFTDAEIEALRLIYEESKKWGKTLGEHIASGDIDPRTPIKLSLPITTELDSSRFSLPTRLFMQMGSENAGIAMNGAVVAAGIYTGGNSAVQYTVTQNSAAKNFYLLSVVFSMSAIANSGVAVLSRACELSGVGVLSEAFGAGFMWCGNFSRAAALRIEGKPIPPELRKSLRKRPAFLNSNGMAFAMSGSCDYFSCSELLANIPFQKIAKVVGISITIYGYSKLVITAYKYGQQFITKYKNRAIAPVEFKTQVQFIVISLVRSRSVRKANIIYKFAIS